MRIAITSLMFLVALSGCQFSKSVKKDLISGLTTQGDGISCENVYLTAKDDKTERNSFIYGEKFNVKFSNIEGFKMENGYVFPGMQLVVTSNTGDTVLLANDLYSEYTNGINLSPLLLTADIRVATPMSSKSDYSLRINIWDKKGNGKFSSGFIFKVITNKKIVLEANKVSFHEIYLFNKERDKVITNNKIRFNENTYMIFEGLSGFFEKNGMVFPGLSLNITDKDGNVILDSKDLFNDYSKSGLSVSDFNSAVSSNFIIPSSEVKNPLRCELILWDKKSDARLKATADLIIE